MTEENSEVNTKTIIKQQDNEILKESFDINFFITEEPPPVEWIIPDLLPCDITAMLTGKGGSGKTFWLLDLMVSIACACPFVGKSEWTPKKPNKVVCVFGEETQDIIHRRLKKIVKSKRLSDKQKQLIVENIIIYSSHGQNPAFNDKIGETGFYTSLIDKIEVIEPILVILDPISRFYKDDENDNTKATMFIEKLERLKTHQTLNEKRKTTIMIAHHTNKGSANDQTSSRGASAFVDGVRWQCLLARNEKNLLGEVIETSKRNLISMTIPKSNHLKYGVNDTTLRVLDDDRDKFCGGVLVECDREQEELISSDDKEGYASGLLKPAKKKAGKNKLY